MDPIEALTTSINGVYAVFTMTNKMKNAKKMNSENRTTEYRLRGDQGVTTFIKACNLSDALEQAEGWARDGSYDNESTIWVTVRIDRLDVDVDGEECWSEVERIHVAINPAEPECTETGHDWQSPIEIVGGIKENPGVIGHGGGVIITECCVHCGCERATDTWAQDSSTGEQGLESASYEPGKYADDIATMREVAANGQA